MKVANEWVAAFKGLIASIKRNLEEPSYNNDIENITVKLYNLQVKIKPSEPFMPIKHNATPFLERKSDFMMSERENPILVLLIGLYWGFWTGLGGLIIGIVVDILTYNNKSIHGTKIAYVGLVIPIISLIYFATHLICFIQESAAMSEEYKSKVQDYNDKMRDYEEKLRDYDDFRKQLNSIKSNRVTLYNQMKGTINEINSATRSLS